MADLKTDPQRGDEPFNRDNASAGMHPDLPLAIAREIRDHKWLFYITGGLSLIIGALAIIVPQAATFAANILVGAVLAASGLVGTITAFQSRKAGRIAGAFFISLLGLAAGLFLLLFPAGGIIALTLFMAAYFIASGGLKAYFAVKMRPAGGWGWMLAGAIASLLLGVLIWSGLPGTAAWVLGLLLGIDMIFYGVGLLAVVSAAKRVEEGAGVDATSKDERDDDMKHAA